MHAYAKSFISLSHTHMSNSVYINHRTYTTDTLNAATAEIEMLTGIDDKDDYVDDGDDDYDMRRMCSGAFLHKSNGVRRSVPRDP